VEEIHLLAKEDAPAAIGLHYATNQLPAINLRRVFTRKLE
jgi:hypothetical protein